jgi:endonuclease/exonuclease/phosphatase family metal-dependent hydrolase
LGIKLLYKKKNEEKETLSVINYNIGVYSMRPNFYNNRDSARLALKNWLLDSDADVKCLQEFANIPWVKEFNLVRQLKERGMNYAFSTDQTGDYHDEWQQGTLIISKYPIISYGDVYASKNGFNRIAYADLKIGSDTVRIVNVHLESMGLSEVDPSRARDLNTVKTQTYTVLRKLKVGVFERSKQVRELADFIEHSPYRVICAGDFNDMPYSYNYRYMKRRLKNSFEESGKGFGFTYNGNKLRMLRIDNQFYSSGVRSVDFQTLDAVKFSDHFPVRGEYLIEKAN